MNGFVSGQASAVPKKLYKSSGFSPMGTYIRIDGAFIEPACLLQEKTGDIPSDVEVPQQQRRAAVTIHHHL
jgi:hypothetical protein